MAARRKSRAGSRSHGNATAGDAVTTVIFRKWSKKDGGDVIALFPEISEGNGLILSYQHLGQHGAASPGIVYATKAATPSEYAPLKRELEQIGYRLKVMKRMSRSRRRG
jgi:hypothetical protein